MSSGMSDEVAEDYRIALEALTLNSRYEISNLTVIAKENTEHALAISEALKNHIKTTSPHKKLPSFYVLDSVVKNVGTPYTLFFGRQLYATFMEAYALVDNNVRRKMDEMLKTWKEPVPGSMDTRPVFPPEVTRPIENALIKAKTSFLQAHQEHLRSQQQLTNRGRQITPQLPYRETSTPPNVPPSVYRQPQQQQQPITGSNYSSQQFFQPDSQQYSSLINNQSYSGLANGNQFSVTNMGQNFTGLSSQNIPQCLTNGNHYDSQPNTHTYSTPPSGNQPFAISNASPNQNYSHQIPNSSSWQQFASQGFSAVESSIDTLNNDVERLISESKAAWTRNMQDTAASTRLKALLDLQSILQNQKLPLDQISLIRAQVAQLSEASKAQPIIQAPRTPALASPHNPPTSLDSILGPGALAALLARQSTISHATPQPVTQFPSPQVPSAQTSYQSAVQVTNSNPSKDSNAVLLEKLRAAGIIGSAQSSTSANSLNLLPSLQTPCLPSTNPNLRAPLVDIPNDLVLKPASLKIPRPYLISNLHEKLGAPCSQCGRRFHSDSEGKKKKEAHMDWHFRVRRRMEDAEMRGQHRSWYVDELDWIKSREVDCESCSAITDLATTAVASAAPQNPKLEYIPVPDDAASANSLCPICQEKFETNWLDEAQEFVWMDAKTVGEKTYHASCFAEVSKSIKSQFNRSTPEPTILGKRKADDDHMAVKTKIKSEPI